MYKLTQRKILTCTILLIIMLCVALCGCQGEDAEANIAAEKAAGKEATTSSAIATDAAVSPSVDNSGNGAVAGTNDETKQKSTEERYGNLDNTNGSSSSSNSAGDTSKAADSASKTPDSSNGSSVTNDNAEKNSSSMTCKISISCKVILNNMDKLTPGKETQVPSDGVILTTKEVPLYEGETAFDVLLRVTKDEGLHMEHTKTPIYKSNYIEGIHNIYEFDCGELSGWMYRVNSEFPSYGCSGYKMKNGDVLDWIYTCDLGRDIGGDWNKQRES